MHRVVFTDGLEEKLIEFRSEYMYQKEKNGKMKKRSVKEKITEVLNRHARELYGEEVGEFITMVVHNKIDNLKANTREHYRKFRQETGTGAGVVDPGSDVACNLEVANANWENFKVSRHRCFGDVPGYGSLPSLSIALLSSLVLASDLPQTPTTPLAPSGYPRPAMRTGKYDEEPDLALLIGGGGQPVTTS